MIATGTCHMSTATSISQNTVSKLRSHRSHSDIRASSPSISSAPRKRLSAAYLVPRVRKQLQEGLLFQTDSRQSRSLCGQSASTFSAVPGRFPVQSATRRHQIRAMSSEPPSEMSGRDGLRRRGGPATVNVSPSSTVISSASPSNVQPTGPASPSNVDIHASATRSNLCSSQTILTDLPSASTLVSNGTSQQSGENRGSSLTPDGWPRLTAVVAGAGPAGAFFALLLARQGYKVEVFERQEWDESAGTWARRHGGWNVALTGRAWAALESVGLTKQVEEKGMRIKYMTTLRGHGAESKLMARKVNFKHYSVAIPDLSEVLIRAGMERHPGQITYHFGMALKSADVEKNTATFSRSSRSSQTNSSNGADETVTVSGDLLVGADGLSSVMRAQMAEQVHQFSVLTDCRGTVKAVSVAVPPEMMAPPRDEVLNPLHGPRFQFDPKTFTVWVRPPMMLGIMPNSRTRVGCSFHGIGMQGQDAAGVSAQIKEYFPEVAELFPPDSEYCETLSKAKELRHCTVNSSQFHHNQTVLLGDAAHAVFNYIGQGTNLAMEDGLILENILAEETEEAKRRAQRQQQPENRRHRLLIQAVAIALERFNAERKKETDAAAWMSEDIPKQDIKQVLAQNKFYEILGRFVPGFLTWQDALNKTLKPPSQIVRQRRLQMWAFRLVQYAAIVLALLAVAAVLKAVKPWALHVLKPKYA